MQNVSDIINWYKKNFRDLPWRATNDPYKIWISEVILQQTQVVTGLKYYYRFITEYPDIASLAAASQEQVLKLWQGLGYYSRARNLHNCSQIINDEYHGKFPQDKNALMKLPGIGEYTASAILSFAFNLPHPTLDGNVFRVISRYYDIHLPVDDPKNKKVFLEILSEMIAFADPRLFNNSMMELGATICKSDNPSCELCPLYVDCQARINGTLNLLPIKGKKLLKRTRFFNYLLIKHEDTFFIRKRTKNDIWKNLYELPLLETNEKIEVDSLRILINKHIFTNTDYNIVKQRSLQHVLTHQKIFVTFWTINLKNNPDFLTENCLMVDMESYTKFPVPVLVSNFLLSL